MAQQRSRQQRQKPRKQGPRERPRQPRDRRDTATGAAATKNTAAGANEHPACRHGVVVANYGARISVRDAAGELHRCVARRRAGYPVCGDRVLWLEPDRAESHDTGRATGCAAIVAIAERDSALERPDRRGMLKPLAANFSQLVVVAADPPGFDTELIDRYLVAAERLGVRAALAINKSDLLGEQSAAAARALLSRYRALDYPACLASNAAPGGLDELAALLRGQTSILVGQSGVGKSSIADRLLPDREIRVGALSEHGGQGSHTTTAATLYELPDGGRLIDSPGVREFPLEHLEGSELAAGFREIATLAGDCRFHNCAHRAEPDCAVRCAVADGRISAERYHSYLRMLAQSAQKD